jgi:signal transduction histidine kinase
MDLAVPVRGLATDQEGRQPGLAACVAMVVAATAAAAVIAVSGDTNEPALVATARAVIVGFPIAIGLSIWRHAANDRFGPLLVAVGGDCLLSTLAESSDAGLYTLGRAAGWVLQGLLVYVILSFPTGRLETPVDRFLAGTTAAVIAVLFLPRLLIAEDFQLPSPYTSCVQDCPGNALFALDREPGIVESVIQPLGTIIAVALLTAVAVRLWRRIRESTRLTAQMLVPVLVVGALQVALVAAGFVVRDADPGSRVTQAVSWAIALSPAALALAFMLGFVRWRLFIGNALEEFAEVLRSSPDADGVQTAFARAFGDHSVEIAFPAREGGVGWVDASGAPVPIPTPGDGRTVTAAGRNGVPVAAVIHDPALEADPRFVNAAVAMAGVVLDNRRLAAETQAAMREVTRSRGRIAATAERERRRIERDLHDSAQQRLVALRIELELTEDLVRSDPERGVERLRQLEGELDQALDELRSLAHGVYPPLLSDRGLPEALQSAARRSAIPVRLATHGVGRYAPEIESAVYFCVLEAIQNAMKHAAGARTLRVQIDGTGTELRFSVRDDGAGAPGGRIDGGAGMTNMNDRLEAVGGELELVSTPGVGTTVRGRLPGGVVPSVSA